jgi:hypothetical protein
MAAAGLATARRFLFVKWFRTFGGLAVMIEPGATQLIQPLGLFQQIREVP